jgi:hypothetical protein
MAVLQEGCGAFGKLILDMGPGYFPFLAAFLSAFLAFFAIYSPSYRSDICGPGAQSG